MAHLYILKTLPGTYKFALYDGDARLTDTELDELFDTAGSLEFSFETPTTTQGYYAVIYYNDDSTQVLQFVVNVASNSSPAWKITWSAKPSSGYHTATLSKAFGKTLLDSELSFLMEKTKSAGKPKTGTGAPTTATVADYEGQSYFDSTNDKMYYCTAITAQGTDPETYEYTWEEFGGGDVTVGQTLSTPSNVAYVATANIQDGAVTAAKIATSTYSTSEQVVGTWIDGKPIYRRVVSTTSPATTGSGESLVDYSAWGISKVISLFGIIETQNNDAFTGGNQFYMWNRKSTSYIAVQVDNNSYVSSPMTIVVEYTKTTD